MASNEIVPAHPPLPTARNLPFQFSAGNQISIWMCESGDGVSVAATRHNGGQLREHGVHPVRHPERERTGSNVLRLRDLGVRERECGEGFTTRGARRR